LESNKKLTNEAISETSVQTANATEQQQQVSKTNLSNSQNEEETTILEEKSTQPSFDTPYVPKFTDLQRKQLDEQLRNVILIYMYFAKASSGISAGQFGIMPKSFSIIWLKMFNI